MARKLKGKIGGKGLKNSLLLHQAFTINQKKINDQSNTNGKQKNKPNSQSKKKLNSHQKEQHDRQLTYIPYDKENDKVMLAGEGDFSYALTILKQGYIKPENLIITSYDSGIKEIELKYPSSGLNNYNKLIDDYGFKLGSNIFFRIDATKFVKSYNTNGNKIDTIFPKNERGKRDIVNHILFNFPHNGKDIKDVDRKIMEHQQLMTSFFQGCIELHNFLLTDSVTGKGKKKNFKKRKIDDFNIHSNNDDEHNNSFHEVNESRNTEFKISVALFLGEPYDSWAIKELAKQKGLISVKSGNFNWAAFPGYSHRKTNDEHHTFKIQNERVARTYTFGLKGKNNDNSKKKKKGENDSDDDYNENDWK